MKTLVPNEDKLNDVSPPEGDDDSVDTEIGTPDLIEKVPDLPENYDEELLNPPIEEEPSKTLKGKPGRRKKKDTFQGNHRSNQSSIPTRRSSRLQRDANVIGSKKSSLVRGRMVGYACNVGHGLTYKVLTDDTQKVICRSRLRLASDAENQVEEA